MEKTPSNVILEAICQVREQASRTLRLQGEEVRRLEQSLELLRNRQREAEEFSRHLLEPIERILADAGDAWAPSIHNVMVSVQNLMKAAYPEQVFDALAGEASQMNLRTVVFSVRGKAAWGVSAGGFELSRQDLHSLGVPLNRENPFRRVFETAEVVSVPAEGLRENLKVLEKLSITSDGDFRLFPIRAGESVTAIFCAECPESGNSILADVLTLLAECAGLQLDRLALLSGVVPDREAPAREAEAAIPRPVEVPLPETVMGATSAGEESSELAASEAAPAVAPGAPEKVIPAEQTAVALLPSPVQDPSELSEEEKKLHRDAQRFSRLLVSEIELYNKEKVQEGRKERDLYLRLKKDIDRSRQTYEKRFGHTAVKRVDYFHEELVRALAEDNPELLGSDYPGPAA